MRARLGEGEKSEGETGRGGGRDWRGRDWRGRGRRRGKARLVYIPPLKEIKLFSFNILCFI